MGLEYSTMKKIFINTILCIILLCASWEFYSFGTGRWFVEYITESDYRRSHPDILPSPITIRIFDMGHSTSYASFLWLQFIQYIADNLWWSRYLDFSQAVLDQITSLHPYFTRPYEVALILSPFSRMENQNTEQRTKNKMITKKAIDLWKKWIQLFCDREKVERINKQKIWPMLWNNAELKNPCIDGILPYLIGFAIYQLWDNKTESSEYYKIASMNDDSPVASRQLSIIALAAEWDFRLSAMNFALVGSEGYDIEPYICRNLALRLVRDIENQRPINAEWIDELKWIESNLKDSRDPNNPISQSSNNCFDMTSRSIKAIYLWYISSVAEGSSAMNGEDLIELGLLKSIPTLSTYKDYTVRKVDGIWEYNQK